jgi:hypothetical protein
MKRSGGERVTTIPRFSPSSLPLSVARYFAGLHYLLAGCEVVLLESVFARIVSVPYVIRFQENW